MDKIDPLYQKYIDGTCTPPDSFAEDSEVKTKAKPKQLELGSLLHIPRNDSKTIGLEMNSGCEFPVCVGNVKDTRREQICVVADDGKKWTLDRPANGQFAGPNHYRYWLWFLDKCQRSADFLKRNNLDLTRPCRVVVRPLDLLGDLDITKFGQAYKRIDQAFTRFSRTVASASSAFVRRGNTFYDNESIGTLCNYKSIYDGGSNYEGWVSPNQFIWDCIVDGYIKTLPFEALMQLDAYEYVAQRLMVHLARRNVKDYSVYLRKLLPKIPMSFARPKEAQSTLEEHHAALCRIGFLERMPDYAGRGQDLRVDYILS